MRIIHFGVLGDQGFPAIAPWELWTCLVIWRDTKLAIAFLLKATAGLVPWRRRDFLGSRSSLQPGNGVRTVGYRGNGSPAEGIRGRETERWSVPGLPFLSLSRRQ